MMWLEAALKMEIEKYEKCPVNQDLIPGYEAAQGWGYIVVGYFLIEQSFKTLIHIREMNAPRTHSLTELFELMKDEDKHILQKFYDDYRLHIGGKQGEFPFNTLDEFICELDGEKDERYKYSGETSWRYYPIEKNTVEELPVVSVYYLHEIVRGCICIIEFATYNYHNPLDLTYSKWMQKIREAKSISWLTDRMNSKGWEELGERLEILWGPDRLGRYFFLIFTDDKNMRFHFSKLPEIETLPEIDKREEFNRIS